MKFDSVVMFSTADWDNPTWTNKQHTAKRLGERGVRLLYLESFGLRKIAVSKGDASRIWRRLKRFFMGAQKRAENVWVFSPLLLPVHDRPWLKIFNVLILKAQIAYCIWRLEFSSPIAWTYNPLALDLIESLKFKFLVYHCVDDLTAAPRMPKETIEFEESRLLKVANVVFVTSEALFEKMNGRALGLLKYYGNVADYAHFAKAREIATEVPKELKGISKPVIGFIGAVSDYKLDFELIAAAARLEPSWQWVLIGQVGEGDPHTDVSTLKAENIHLLGPRPYAELPAYLKGFDVVTLPCRLNDYTKSMFPMKFFEYLAAGKMIVATEIASLDDHRDMFLAAHDANSFVEALRSVLTGKVSFTPAMDKVAQENTWETRLDRMLADIEVAMTREIL